MHWCTLLGTTELNLTWISCSITYSIAVLEHKVKAKSKGHGDDDVGEDEADDDADADLNGHIQTAEYRMEATQLKQLGEDHHHADA